MKWFTAIGVAALGAASINTSAQAQSWATPTTSGTPLAREEVASCQISASLMLIAGGSDISVNAEIANDEAKRYNSAAKTWVNTASMPAARAGGQLIKVPNDDKCLYIGGVDEDGIARTDIFEYDSSDDDWDDTGVDLNEERYAFAVGQLSASKFVIFGGREHTTPSYATPREIEIINAVPGSYGVSLVNNGAGTQFLTGRAYLDVVELPGADSNGVKTVEFYVMGGETSGSPALATVEMLRLRQDAVFVSFSAATDDLDTARTRLVAFRVDGAVPFAGGAKATAQIVVTSGYDGAGAPLGTSEKFDKGAGANGTWSAAKSMTSPRIRAQKVQIATLAAQEDFTNSSGFAFIDAHNTLVVGGADELGFGLDQSAGDAAEDTVATSQVWSITSGDWASAVNMVDGHTNGFALQCLVDDASALAGFAAYGTEVAAGAETTLSSIETYK